MSGKYEKMKKLIQDIDGVGFECEAGYLSGLVAWQELKKEIEKLGAMERLEPRCVDIRPKNHIERMEEEAQELEIKIDKLSTFLSKEMEEKKYTDEHQRQLLAIQRDLMIRYYSVLLERIGIDKFKSKMEKIEKTEDTSCSTSGDYDQAVEDCTRK